MTQKQQKGKRESPWLVARRCLALLLRAQQGPASKAALLAAVYAVEGAEAYGDAGVQERAKRFENDKQRLWQRLGIRLRYDKEAGGYVLAEQERPLLNLPDEDIETLALLADTFRPDSPHAPAVQQLLDRLVGWLPAERQKLFRRAGGQIPTADLRMRDSERIAPDVWEAALAAWQAGQELQFDYLSSQHTDGIPRQHHVQPWDLDFTDRGHWRLRGYCLFNDGPNGPWEPRDYIHYRLSRIVAGSARVLPRKLPAIRPWGKPREVIFELSPEIARFGISQRKELIGTPAVTEMEGGWLRVAGKTHDVFDLARNLLYYGANCRVLGGPELLREMCGLVRELSESYLVIAEGDSAGPHG